MAHRQPSAEASAVEASRFEGETVEEVLAEVRATLGADAEIVEANKVRRGGLGGFFAKESVEVMARPRAAHPAPDADPVTPASLQDIVAAISAREDATRTEDATRADDDAGPEVPAPSAPAPADPTVTTAPTPSYATFGGIQTFVRNAVAVDLAGAVNVLEVPTVSELGMLALALVLGISGLVVLRR